MDDIGLIELEPPALSVVVEALAGAVRRRCNGGPSARPTGLRCPTKRPRKHLESQVIDGHAPTPKTEACRATVRKKGEMCALIHPGGCAPKKNSPIGCFCRQILGFCAARQQAVGVGGGSCATPVSPRRKRDLGRLPIAQRDPSRTQAKAARRALTTQALAIHRDVWSGPLLVRMVDGATLTAGGRSSPCRSESQRSGTRPRDRDAARTHDTDHAP